MSRQMARLSTRMARRDLLRHAGLATVASPFIKFLSAPAHAQPADSKRLVIFVTGNGTVMNEFWPDPGFAFRRILQPLAPWKDKLLVLRGLDMKAWKKAPIPRDHLPDLPNLLTARQPHVRADGTWTPDEYWMEGISIDQHIANGLRGQTKWPSLYLGVSVAPDHHTGLVARGTKLRVSPSNDPAKVYNDIFANWSPGGTPVDPAAEKLLADRKSVLDFIKGDLTDLRCRLGREERETLDSHLDSVRTMEGSLLSAMNTPLASCKKPAAPTSAITDYVATGQAQMDLIVSALVCDLTRVIVILWGGSSSNQQYPWLGIPRSHHGISHNSEGVNADNATRTEWLTQIETWQAGQFAYLVKRLNEIDDVGGGKMLDRSVLVWAHEQSDGFSHKREDMPFVLAGGGGTSHFKTGRAIAFNKVSHSGLLVSLANAMGVPTASFGDPDFATGPLAELRG